MSVQLSSEGNQKTWYTAAVHQCRVICFLIKIRSYRQSHRCEQIDAHTCTESLWRSNLKSTPSVLRRQINFKNCILACSFNKERDGIAMKWTGSLVKQKAITSGEENCIRDVGFAITHPSTEPELVVRS